MEAILKILHEPKTLELEKTDDGRYRILITVKKLGAFTAVEFFLNPDEAQSLRDALIRQAWIHSECKWIIPEIALLLRGPDFARS